VGRLSARSPQIRQSNFNDRIGTRPRWSLERSNQWLLANASAAFLR
jgi:hypothetical protein